MNIKYLLFLIVLLLGNICLYAQYYDNGQDPSNFRWRSLKTQYYHIIYPDFYEEKAQKIGLISDSLYPLVKGEMNFNGKKKYKSIPLILHTRSSYSNAFSVWAPRRIEWHTGSSQNIYAQPWFEQLAIHETRHDLQMQRLGQNFVGVWTSILGEHTIGLFAGTLVPTWFLEGDAVWAETQLSNAGRGREGDFIALNKAQIIDKGIYSYDKAAFGSYKDFVPNVYNFGYHLIAYTNEHVEQDLWQTGLDKASKISSLKPFNLSGRRKQIYQDAMNYWKSEWLQDTVGKEANTKVLTPTPKTYTNYYSPVFVNDSTIYALKSDYQSAIRLVEVNKENDYLIKYFGNCYDGYLDHFNNKLTWVENIPDKRWQTIVFTDLIVMDIETGKNKRLSKKTHYFSPVFSGTGEQIAVIEIDSLDNSKLIIINSENGNISSVSGSFPYALSYPAWSNDDKEIYFIQLTSIGKSIHNITLATNETSEILPNTYSNIRNLKIVNDILYFVSDQSGCSQIYAMRLHSKEIFQITQSKYGVGNYCFSTDNKDIVFTNYTADGYNILKQPIDFSEKIIYNANHITEQDSCFDLAIIDSIFPSKPYPKIKNLVNFHSFSPLGNIVSDDLPKNPGITFMSQNLLSTSFIEAGYARNLDENANQFFLGFTYKGFYPVLSTSQLLQQRKVRSKTKSISWNEFNSKYSISFPFSFYRYNHSFGISLKGHYEFTYQYNASLTENNRTRDISLKNIHTGGLDISFIHTVKKGYAQLQPNWKQYLYFNYRKGFYGNQNSTVYAISGYFYFPGLFKTHSFSVYAGYQEKDETAVTFSNLIRRPRGTESLYLENGSTSLQFNYSFPIAYPDGGIPGFFYCKRLVASPFYDILETSSELYHSTGLELVGDWNFLRLDFPVTLGIQCAYLPGDNTFSWKVLFSVAF